MSKPEAEYPTEDPVYPTEDEAPQQKEKAVEEPAHEEPAQPSGDEEAEEQPVHADVEKPKEKKSAPLDWGAWVFFILFFCSFVFVITGISMGQFMHNSDGTCISIWGKKPKCFGTWFQSINWTTWPDGQHITMCEKGDSLMQAAQAFSIMSVIGTFLTVMVGILEIIKFADLKIVACIMACITTVATLVSWCTMLAIYWGNLCGRMVYADTHHIGAGLALNITAWCVQMLADFLLILASCLVPSN